MSIFFNIAWGAGLAAASPYIAVKLIANRRWRKGFRERLGNVPRREGDRPCIWIHGPSVGEINAAKPLYALIRERLPQYDVVVSAFTPEGREQGVKNFGSAFLLPLDFTPFLKRAVEAVRPDCVVFIERDLWPNFLSALYGRGIPAVVANGIVSERMVRRMRLLNRLSGGLAGRRLLGRVGAYCVQTGLYAERLEGLGVDKGKIFVTGNMKYDNLCDSVSAERVAALRRALGAGERDWFLVAGSTAPGEEAIVLEAFRQLRRKYDNVRLVIVPRHIDRAEDVEKAVAAVGYARARKTAIDSGAFNREQLRGAVVIVDKMGELLDFYAIASAAFVGGSIVEGRGGQNMLESAALGVATLFGPHVKNFQESADLLLGAEGAKMVRDAREMYATLDFLRDNPVKSADIAARGREAALKVRGAGEKTFERLEAILGTARKTSR